jgi:hypothetical protein
MFPKILPRQLNTPVHGVWTESGPQPLGRWMTGMILGWFASLIVDHDFYFLDILVTYKYFIYIKIMGCDLLELLPPTR